MDLAICPAETFKGGEADEGHGCGVDVAEIGWFWHRKGFGAETVLGESATVVHWDFAHNLISNLQIANGGADSDDGARNVEADLVWRPGMVLLKFVEMRRGDSYSKAITILASPLASLTSTGLMDAEATLIRTSSGLVIFGTARSLRIV